MRAKTPRCLYAIYEHYVLSESLCTSSSALLLRENFEEEEEPEEEEELEEEEAEEEEQEEMDPDDEIDKAEFEATTAAIVGTITQVRPYVRRFSGTIHVRGGSSSTALIADDSEDLIPSGMRRDIHFLRRDQLMKRLDSDLRDEIQYNNKIDQIVTTLGDHVRVLEEDKDREENKRLKRELEDTRLSKDRVERDFYHMRVWAHGFYGEMVRVGAVREEGPSEVAKDIAADQATRGDAEGAGGPVGGAVGPSRVPTVQIKKLMTEEFCPMEEIQRMEQELWNLKVTDYNISAYTHRFNELALLCPTMVEPEHKKIKAYICRLSENIIGHVTLSKPANINELFHMAHALMEQRVQARAEREVEGEKRKWENFQAEQGGYAGNQPFFKRCGKHHAGFYTIKCNNYGKASHQASLLDLEALTSYSDTIDVEDQKNLVAMIKNFSNIAHKELMSYEFVFDMRPNLTTSSVHASNTSW
ncbi:putative reverse transcriptase domain-containing protein [Tanacetum coccineum]